MFNLFSKSGLLALAALLSFSTINSNLAANEYCDPCDNTRTYIGAFGGGIWSNSPDVNQFGTAFFPAPPTSIGPLSVIGEGHLNKTSAGFGGVQLGYEWRRPSCSCWTLAPAVELEAFFYSHNKSGHLINQTVNGLPEHDFLDSFRMNSSVVLANLVFSGYSDNLWGLTPYIGGGLGGARVSLNRANSLQVAPAEAGVNHFNSDTSDSVWTFAAQIKAGLRYNFCRCFHVFAEYRFLYLDDCHYVFGPTNYTTHVQTSPWNVRVRNITYNAFTVGIQYDL